ncbi:peptide ABC transporter substrate-binding protein [Vallicoccus soli]|uniref:ABC transporter substrate-binding protein n=1 Tax=Vallicoccus soli TaxID=2339232 RepID=A0A3A3Z4W8_9ACTN|nr:ABC transporter substrate-binding protein [Vallicoccus soli]RJK97998.1 ABC transporter substrate-binding protein [Vallicoccus soli]
MRGLERARWAVGVASIALLATACGGGDDDNAGGSGGDSAGGPSGTVTIQNGEPQNPLVGFNTNETEGGLVVDSITTGLVEYDVEDGSPVMAVAESIETDDNTTYTVTLKDWTFHDGSPVTANSFVDAWNYGAYGPNAQLNSYFFEPIQGYTEVQGEDANGDETITADEAPVTEMSGLKVVDDKTFTITLTAPASSFINRLGYSAFVPLPESFFEDPEAYGEEPVGNGPFRFVSWDHDVQIDVEAWEDYPGERPAQVQAVQFKVYTDSDAAYADLTSGNLDIVDTLPTSALAGEQFKSDLGEGRYVEQPEGVFQSFTLPQYLPEYADPNLGKALSLAIDRESITQTIFNGGRTPATGWVAPVVEGYVEGQCGEFCTYDPAKAKEYFAQTDFQGPLTIGYNADGDHKAWVDATCNSIKNAIGLDCQGQPTPDFATFREAITNREEDGAFRTGWQMDYPSIENFLAPLYATGASSNDGEYSNPQFDQLLQQAASAEGEESLELYQQAERLLAEDMTVIPLWYSTLQAGWSERLENVRFTPFGTPDLQGITVSE